MAKIQGNWADTYRKKWTWDKVTWGGHSVDCYPGGCPWRVYTKDGKILREEQGAALPPIEEGIPDMNPMGCQKGASWSHCHYSPDRVTQPLKRVGERGEGKFKPVSWDEALTDICDAIIDAIQEQGAESVLTLLTPEPGAAPARIFTQLLGTPITDGNAEFHDFSPGFHITWGLFNPVSTMDDWFLADLTLIWHANPIYTNIHWYHYIAESRYNGGEVVTIAPDYSPSAIHADLHLPVRIGTDAALALSMCKVIIDAGLYRKQFVQEQTDMALLVRRDTGRFLRGSEVNADRDDQFFWWDTLTDALAPAPRQTLATTGLDPALEGSYTVTLADGAQVEVEPVFERLKRHLENYTPEKAAAICEIHPDNIRQLARKVATRKTKIFIGWNSGKYYHGDLMERSMALLLGLTGNWGKKGTGARSWAIMGMDGFAFMNRKGGAGQEAAQKFFADLIAMRRMLGQADPTMTAEMMQNRAAEMASEFGGVGNMVPPAFLWYYQYGYKERWNSPDNNDPSMKRPFDAYINEAIDKGWWDASYSLAYREGVEPRVIIEAGGNLLRRQRGGQKILLERLWPKLKMFVSIDYRMTTTGMYSDYILPAAQHYEKLGTSMQSIHHLNYVLCDRAAKPLGAALPDTEIGLRFIEKLEERAKARGFTEYTDRKGNPRTFVGLVERATHGGAVRDEEKRFDEAIRDLGAYGVLPKGTTLQTLRDKGAIRFVGWGIVGHGIQQGSTIRPNEVHNPFRWHTEDKVPYDTLVRRAQFYIDHEWFLEAGEELPTHKEPPPQGGRNRRFLMTSGHNRWSIHSMNMTNNIMLNTHRGEPFVFINDKDAASLGITNGERVKMVNDVGEMIIQAKITPSCRPGQVIVYNGFEPYMHEGWYSQADLEPGPVKHLGLVGNYGHLKYRMLSWQPVPVDRAVRVDVQKIA